MAINPLDIRKKTNQPQTGGLNTQGQTTEQVRQQASTLNKSKVVQNQNIQPSTVQTSDLKQSGVTPQVGETGTQLLRRTALDVAQREKRRGGMRLPTNTVEAKTDEEALMVAEQKAKEKASMVEAQKSVFSEIPKTEEATPEQPPLSESERLIEEKQAIQDKLASQYDEIEGRQVSMSEIAKEQQFAQKTAQKQMRDIEVQEREIADVERRKAQTKDAEEASLLEFQKQEKLAGVQSLMGSDPEMSYTAASMIWDNQQKQIAEGFLEKKEADLFNDYMTREDATPEGAWDTALQASNGDIDKASKLLGSRFSQNFVDEMKEDQYIKNGEDPATAKTYTEVEKATNTYNKLLDGEITGGLDGKRQFYDMIDLYAKNDPDGLIQEGILGNIIDSDTADREMKDVARTTMARIKSERINKEGAKTGKQMTELRTVGDSVYGITYNSNTGTWEKQLVVGDKDTMEAVKSLKSPLDEFREKMMKMPTKYGIPTQIINSDKERASFEDAIDSGVKAGLTFSEIRDEFLGYTVTPKNKPFADRIRQKLIGTKEIDKERFVDFANMINAGNRIGAVNSMERAYYDEARKNDPDFYIGEAGVVKVTKDANRLNELINKLEKTGESPIGIFKGTFEEWVGDFKSKEGQQVRSEIMKMTKEFANKYMGASMTEHEKAFYSDLLPRLDEKMSSVQTKVGAMKDDALTKMNAIRASYGQLPELTEESLLDPDKRVESYEQMDYYDPFDINMRDEIDIPEDEYLFGPTQQQDDFDFETEYLGGASAVVIPETAIQQTEPLKKNPDGSVSFGKANTQRPMGTQCGGFVNDILGLKGTGYHMGDTLASKMRNPKFKKIETGGKPMAGDYFVSDPLGIGDTPDNPGHTGLIKEVTPYGIVIEDYNRMGDQQRRMSFVPYDSEEYKTFQGFGSA